MSKKVKEHKYVVGSPTVQHTSPPLFLIYCLVNFQLTQTGSQVRNLICSLIEQHTGCSHVPRAQIPQTSPLQVTMYQGPVPKGYYFPAIRTQNELSATVFKDWDGLCLPLPIGSSQGPIGKWRFETQNVTINLKLRI